MNISILKTLPLTYFGTIKVHIFCKSFDIPQSCRVNFWQKKLKFIFLNVDIRVLRQKYK